jgi:hypothetical protein
MNFALAESILMPTGFEVELLTGTDISTVGTSVAILPVTVTGATTITLVDPVFALPETLPLDPELIKFHFANKVMSETTLGA